MAKRAQKVRKYRKKRGLRLFYQLLSVLVILAAVIGGCIIFFKVEETVVDGAERYSGGQILAVAEIPSNANLLFLSEKEVSERIKEGLPYVRKVKLERKFPTTLHLVIEESVPLAVVQQETEWAVLDSDGKVLEFVEEGMQSEYIQVTGLTFSDLQVGDTAEAAEEDKTQFRGLCNLLTSLEKKEVAGEVTWIDLNDKSEIEMGYMGGRFTVRLPVGVSYEKEKLEDRSYDRKIEILKAMIPKLNESDEGVIDLRKEEVYFRPGNQ